MSTLVYLIILRFKYKAKEREIIKNQAIVNASVDKKQCSDKKTEIMEWTPRMAERSENTKKQTEQVSIEIGKEESANPRRTSSIMDNPTVGTMAAFAIGMMASKAASDVIENAIPAHNPNIERYKKAQDEARNRPSLINNKASVEKKGYYTISTMPNGDQTLQDAGKRVAGRYDKRKNVTYYGNSFKEVEKGNLLESLMK